MLSSTGIYTGVFSLSMVQIHETELEEKVDLLFTYYRTSI